MEVLRTIYAPDLDIVPLRKLLQHLGVPMPELLHSATVEFGNDTKVSFVYGDAKDGRPTFANARFKKLSMKQLDAIAAMLGLKDLSQVVSFTFKFRNGEFAIVQVEKEVSEVNMQQLLHILKEIK
jgi:hypothetical protein